MPGEAALLRPLGYRELPGWASDDHASALACFRKSIPAVLGTSASRGGAQPSAALRAASAAARAVSGTDPAAARAFFEGRFAPKEIVPRTGAGLLTGYYEPEIEGRMVPQGEFRTPLLSRPADLVSTGPGLPPGLAAGRRTASGSIEPYPDRAAIEAGALSSQNLELVYVAGPVEAFFAQIQGSVRVRLPDRVLRVRYAGRNGHPYTPIGRVLVEQGHLRREEVTMQSIRAWLAANPQAVSGILHHNKSYVFFAVDAELSPSDGPRGGAGVPLTAGRSLAVDRTIWPYGLPIYVQAALPSAGGGESPLLRLLIAQDTGSAIVGAARGDLFIGSGEQAGAVAGLLKAPARFFVLEPKARP